MFEIRSDGADGLYAEAMWKFKHTCVTEDSRNGKVWTQPFPSLITMVQPRKRVLFNAQRDANPFFHLMEAIWMWAGRDDLEWIQQFNKGIGRYAEDVVEYVPEVRRGKAAYFHGAYGRRWRGYFGTDQIKNVVANIKQDPYGRQHMIQMWDAGDMLADVKDKPCNVQLMFRVTKTGNLDMTVINRSNDLVWGALGANIVHMTMLHELIARSTGLPLGIYRVFSNNLHVYEQHWDLFEYKTQADNAADTAIACRALGAVDIDEWLLDAENFCNDTGDGNAPLYHHEWFVHVAIPMKQAYLDKRNRHRHIAAIQCPAWKKGAEEWVERRKAQTTAK